MTLEEFSNQKWGSKMSCEYRGNRHDIISVDFFESLIGFDDSDDEDESITWVRCENISNIK